MRRWMRGGWHPPCSPARGWRTSTRTGASRRGASTFGIPHPVRSSARPRRRPPACGRPPVGRAGSESPRGRVRTVPAEVARPRRDGPPRRPVEFANDPHPRDSASHGQSRPIEKQRAALLARPAVGFHNRALRRSTGGRAPAIPKETRLMRRVIAWGPLSDSTGRSRLRRRPPRRDPATDFISRRCGPRGPAPSLARPLPSDRVGDAHRVARRESSVVAMSCPYLKEVVMLFCDAYPVKKMLPLDRIATAHPCLGRDFEQCPLFRELMARLAAADACQGAGQNGTEAERRERHAPRTDSHPHGGGHPRPARH